MGELIQLQKTKKNPVMEVKGLIAAIILQMPFHDFKKIMELLNNLGYQAESLFFTSED